MRKNRSASGNTTNTHLNLSNTRQIIILVMEFSLISEKNIKCDDLN